MEESWKPVVGYEGLYEVSDLGRVRSLDRVVKGKRNSKWERKGRILQQANRGNGYYAVCLHKSGTQKMLANRKVQYFRILFFGGNEC